MFLGVVGFTAVVLFVLAVSAHSNPVPAGVQGDGMVLPGLGVRAARRPPSRVQALLTVAGYSLAVWAVIGSVWLADSVPTSPTQSATTNRAATRDLHAVLAYLILTVVLSQAIVLTGTYLGYRANRGRDRWRGFFRPGSLLGDTYRVLGLATALKVIAATSLYGLTAVVVVHHIAS